MIVCPTCRAQHINGTLFCEECGADLQTPGVATLGLETAAGPQGATTLPAIPALPRTTRAAPIHSPYETLPTDAMPTPTAIPAPPKPERVPTRPALPARRDLELIMLNTGRKLAVPDGKETLIIGRSDVLSGEAPDVDLESDNAIALGVSRRHACITLRDNAPYVTDLGSTNRTFLNRQPLLRGQPYPLRDGDEIRLGNAILRVLYKPLVR